MPLMTFHVVQHRSDSTSLESILLLQRFGASSSKLVYRLAEAVELHSRDTHHHLRATRAHRTQLAALDDSFMLLHWLCHREWPDFWQHL